MKMTIGALIFLTSISFSAGAENCPLAVEQLSKLKNEILEYNVLLRRNFELRANFTAQLYNELSVNEGRALYIPFGTYESVQRSVVKERMNRDDVIQTTNKLDADLARLAEEIAKCLGGSK